MYGYNVIDFIAHYLNFNSIKFYLSQKYSTCESTTLITCADAHKIYYYYYIFYDFDFFFKWIPFICIMFESNGGPDFAHIVFLFPLISKKENTDSHAKYAKYAKCKVRDPWFNSEYLLIIGFYVESRANDDSLIQADINCVYLINT